MKPSPLGLADYFSLPLGYSGTGHAKSKPCKAQSSGAQSSSAESQPRLSALRPEIDATWLARSSPEVAADLLGCFLVRRYLDGRETRALIVETEAYAPGDPACHAYRRQTPRNTVMFGPAGLAYVYLIYGMYHCFNVVTDQDGVPSAVLIRAAELDHVPDTLTPSQRRSPRRVAAGPGKLCRALDIDRSLTAHPLQTNSALWLEHRSPNFEADLQSGQLHLIQTTRIGLSQGQDIPWRWYVNESVAVSKR
ncbi:MAG: DNA-3-methyladenine glycosylase [Elainellaceae cyanobacterium]